MTRRKQETIFSRLSGIEAEFETPKEKKDQAPVRPHKNEPDESPLPSTPAGVSEDSDLFPAKSAKEIDAPVSPSVAEQSFQPLSFPEPVPVYSHPSGEKDIFAALESSFVFIAPGTLLMGSPDYEAGRAGDETIHEVTLTKPFSIQNIPVTQGLWKAVMGANPAFFRGAGDDLPVESVSWNECREFLRKLNSLTNGNYRLPTEAEWEYACRAGSGTAFSAGDISELYCARDPVLRETGWYCGNSGRKTQPVARKNPNAWGLFDMHGNVSEWCLDWYGDYHEDADTDPCGPKSGPGKVVRGGSWFGSAKNCRSAARFHWPPNMKSDSIGLRLVRETP